MEFLNFYIIANKLSLFTIILVHAKGGPCSPIFALPGAFPQRFFKKYIGHFVPYYAQMLEIQEKGGQEDSKIFFLPQILFLL